MSRPSGKLFTPTREQRAMVRAMVSCGLQLYEIAMVLDITRPTLDKYFKREIATARTVLVTSMRMLLIAKARAGDTLALLHINKVLGWNEKLVVVDGAAEVDPATLSEAELLKRIGALRRLPAVVRATRPARPAKTMH